MEAEILTDGLPGRLGRWWHDKFLRGCGTLTTSARERIAINDGDAEVCEWEDLDAKPTGLSALFLRAVAVGMVLSVAMACCGCKVPHIPWPPPFPTPVATITPTPEAPTETEVPADTPTAAGTQAPTATPTQTSTPLPSSPTPTVAPWPTPCDAAMPAPERVVRPLTPPCGYGFEEAAGTGLCFAKSSCQGADQCGLGTPRQCRPCAWLAGNDLWWGHNTLSDGWLLDGKNGMVDAYCRLTYDGETLRHGVQGWEWRGVCPPATCPEDEPTPTLGPIAEPTPQPGPGPTPFPGCAVESGLTLPPILEKFKTGYSCHAQNGDNCQVDSTLITKCGPCDPDHLLNSCCGCRSWDDPLGPVWEIDGEVCAPSAMQSDLENAPAFGRVFVGGTSSKCWVSDRNPYQVWVVAPSGSTFRTRACSRPDVQSEEGIPIPVQGSGCGENTVVVP